MLATPLNSAKCGSVQSVPRAPNDQNRLRLERGSTPLDPNYSRSSEMARRGSRAILQFQSVQKSHRESTSSRLDEITSTFADRRTPIVARKDSYQSAQTPDTREVNPRSNSLHVPVYAGHAESKSSHQAQARLGADQSFSIFTCLPPWSVEHGANVHARGGGACNPCL